LTRQRADKYTHFDEKISTQKNHQSKDTRMKKTLALLVCLLLCVSLFPAAARAEEAENAFPEGTRQKIDKYIQREMARGKIPGLSLAIVRGDKLLYSAGYGEAYDGGASVTADTPFTLGSIAKAFTALAIRQLVNEGKLDYSARVTRYIPWFTAADKAASDKITVLDLVNHTSGFSTASGNGRYLGDIYSLETLVRKLDAVPLNRPAGTGEEYSNLNYLLLGHLIEVVSGMSYADFIQANIFDPMGMQHSFTSEQAAMKDGLAAGHRIVFGIPIQTQIPFPTGNLAHGFLISSANDMAKFMRLYLNNGYLGEMSLIPDNELSRPQDPLAPLEAGVAFYDVYWKPANVTLGYYGHGGANVNYRTDFVVNQSTRYGVVVLTNVRSDFFAPAIDAASISAGITLLLAGRVIPNAQPIAISPAGWSLILVSVGMIAFSLLRLFRTRKFLPAVRTGGWRRTRKLLFLALFDLLLPLAAIVSIYTWMHSSILYGLQAIPEQTLPALIAIALLLTCGGIKLCQLARERKRTKPTT
jgi:CubicO group peptidase (beta-lactamase class C family)